MEEEDCSAANLGAWTPSILSSLIRGSVFSLHHYRELAIASDTPFVATINNALGGRVQTDK